MEISAKHIVEAYSLVKPHINQTPVLTSTLLNQLTESELYFKCENFQKTGSFKARGATHAALRLTQLEKAHGLVTHSSGNHGQAVAYAAKTLQTKATVIMPNNAPMVKIDAVKNYNGDVIFCEPGEENRKQATDDFIAQNGGSFIHPFNNFNVIIGQATCAYEFYNNNPDLDFMLAPVGGGGLLSGTGLSTQYFSSKTKLFGCEPEGAADAVYSLKSGIIQKAQVINTIADGLLTSLGNNTFPIIQNTVADIVLVNDDEIKYALKLIYQTLKIVIEPSAALTLAVVLKNKKLFKGKKTGIIICGGNVDLTKLSGWF